MYPPSPSSFEKDVHDPSGVTGPSGGVGKEVTRMLYEKNGKVHIAARNDTKASVAIADSKRSGPHSTGSLVFQHLETANLSTITKSAEGGFE
jgi:NADP-dependent 3-hydroxy acid dehydrogenase YdfG